VAGWSPRRHEDGGSDWGHTPKGQCLAQWEGEDEFDLLYLSQGTLVPIDYNAKMM